MKYFVLIWLFLCSSAQSFFNELDVKINPTQSELKIKIKTNETSFLQQRKEFYLNRDLKVSTSDKGVLITPCAKSNTNSLLIRCWQIQTYGKRSHEFSIDGKIENINDQAHLEGFISPKGAILLPNTYWYPVLLGGESYLPKLKVTVPKGWTVITSEWPSSRSQLDSKAIFSEPLEKNLNLQNRNKIFDSHSIANLNTTPNSLKSINKILESKETGIHFSHLFELMKKQQYSLSAQKEKTVLDPSTFELELFEFKISSYQEGLYLLAGPFYIYKKQVDDIWYRVALQMPNEFLAQSYLDVMPNYLKYYENLLLPYSYSHFSVVENFWETGYGLSASTLLGSRVMRLPFILKSSLPHEILHSWFGNRIYIDDKFGNWAEGLTTYLSDHEVLLNESFEKGKTYRLNLLLRYQDYHQGVPELPLSEFRQRHNESSQSLGYGKGLFLFHMLKERVGSENFFLSLQKLIKMFEFKINPSMHFYNIADVFSEVSRDQGIKKWFDDWLLRSGSLELSLDQVKQVLYPDQSYSVSFYVEQIQRGSLYQFDLPVTFTFESGEKIKKTYRLDRKSKQFVQDRFFSKVSAVQLDADYDLFRKIGFMERPPHLSQVFGSKSVAWWDENLGDLEIFYQNWKENLIDTSFNKIQGDLEILNQDLIIIGQSDYWKNKLSTWLPEFKWVENLIYFQNNIYDLNRVDVVLCFKNPISGKTVLWVIPAEFTEKDKFSRRLIHYTSTSFLFFEKKKLLEQGSFLMQDSELRFVFKQ